MSRLAAKIVLILVLGSAIEPALATKFLNYRNPSEIDTVYNDDVFLAGTRKIKFDSKVNGDLFSISSEMVQTDTVTGNFMPVSITMQNLGPILGSYRAVAWNLSCNADVGRNLLILAHDVTIGPTSHIGRNADIAAVNVVFQGDIQGDLQVKARSAMISGRVGGNLYFGGDSLTINPNTIIVGDINYSSPIRATIAPGSSITGKINWQQTEPTKQKQGKGPGIIPTWIVSLRGYFLLSTLISAVVITVTLLKLPGWLALLSLWVIMAVSGNILLLICKSRAKSTVNVLEIHFFPSMGLGFICFLLTPILAMVLFLIIITAPLGPILFMLFGIAIFAGGIFASLYIGRQICGIFNPSSAGTPGYLCYTVGMTVILALSIIPIVGYLILLVTLMTGLGALVQTFRKPRELPSVAQVTA